jgi:hypothetical protein
MTRILNYTPPNQITCEMAISRQLSTHDESCWGELTMQVNRFVSMLLSSSPRE